MKALVRGDGSSSIAYTAAPACLATPCAAAQSCLQVELPGPRGASWDPWFPQPGTHGSLSSKAAQGAHDQGLCKQLRSACGAQLPCCWTVPPEKCALDAALAAAAAAATCMFPSATRKPWKCRRGICTGRQERHLVGEYRGAEQRQRQPRRSARIAELLAAPQLRRERGHHCGCPRGDGGVALAPPPQQARQRLNPSIRIRSCHPITAQGGQGREP